MIKCHLSRMMGERRIKISDLSRELGVHRNSIALLYHEKAKRVELDLLDKLCKYFGCKVGDILEYKED
ncbi:MAG: helix-turn-helix transcriptional regulator [Deltaproteobacteria bacterium]|nr:helix-turn-helix transcriptional regulator [Deltaproteobacteria bacterium]